MKKDQTVMIIYAPISIGEIIDKITILEIKAQRIKDPEMLKNVNSELELLSEILANAGTLSEEVSRIIGELKVVNKKLWDIEDGKRECERLKNFSYDFVELARSAYLTNDRRSQLKKKINEKTGSDLIEEKLYKGYAMR